MKNIDLYGKIGFVQNDLAFGVNMFENKAKCFSAKQFY